MNQCQLHISCTILDILFFLRFQSSCESSPCICGKVCRPVNHESDYECDCFDGSSKKPCEKLYKKGAENFYFFEPKRAIEPTGLEPVNNVLLLLDSFVSFWSKTRI